jgi:hypothetical protein
MNQTYLAVVPAIGFAQVWLSPAQDRFADTTFDDLPVDPAAELRARSLRNRQTRGCRAFVIKQRGMSRDQRRRQTERQLPVACWE